MNSRLLTTDLAAYVDPSGCEVHHCDMDIDEEWDSFVSGCEERGIERYLELHQTAYDRMYKAE